MKVRADLRDRMPRGPGAITAGVLLAGAVAWAATSLASITPSGAGESCSPRSVAPPKQVTDAYDRQVLSLGPVLYLTLAHPKSGTEEDLSGNGHNGTYYPAGHWPALARLPNGDPAASFNGVNQYLQVPSASVLSVPHTGCLTVEAWIRPGTLQFSHEEGTGYVYLLGKGVPGKYEYALRMYSQSNAEIPERPNRISAYAFNLAGGLGSGSYFQGPVRVGNWMMVAFVIDRLRSSAWPHGYVAIYRDGVLSGQVSLSQYHVSPRASNAPLRVATRDLGAYFQGAIAKVAVYDYALSGADMAKTYGAM
jgi:Concanavalin A-like lectin/glucanases superfamily